jgi:hypothetical protein
MSFDKYQSDYKDIYRVNADAKINSQQFQICLVPSAFAEEYASINPEVEKTAMLIQEINRASQEQASGTEQINHSMQQLNLISQQNATSSEELALNSESMKEYADDLKRIVGFFKLNGYSAYKDKLNITKNEKTISEPEKSFDTNVTKDLSFVEEKTDSEFETF